MREAVIPRLLGAAVLVAPLVGSDELEEGGLRLGFVYRCAKEVGSDLSPRGGRNRPEPGERLGSVQTGTDGVSDGEYRRSGAAIRKLARSDPRGG